jgi:pimeloyl-ACP methyl ester carboxylesterase
MRTIVLVHGAWHGPWCWSPVLARLDELGIPSVAVELELRDVHRDAEIVTAALDAVGHPVVLVGHSYGGIVITEAGAHPLVERLVYVCAFAPDEGETVLGLALDHPVQSDLGAAMVLQPDGTSTLEPALAADALYGDCSAADVERSLGLLRAQGGDTFTQPPKAVAWKERPTTYVVCGADRAVAPSLQREMAERIPDAAVVEWPDSSHSPFLSRPAEVAELLASLSP